MFCVLFSDKEEKISDFYDDLSWGYTLGYAHTYHVNHKDSEGYLIAFNINHTHKKITHGTISHEIFHAASCLLRKRGMKLSSSSEEAYAYLIDWMTDKVYDIIKKNKIDVV